MRPTFEPLETRRMMSASLKSGVLRVAGSTGNDRIAVTLEKGQIVVTTNGRREGRFASSAVRSITIDAGAGAGNDAVSVSSLIKQDATLFGRSS